MAPTPTLKYLGYDRTRKPNMQFHPTTLLQSIIICLEILLALGFITLIYALFFSGSRTKLPASRQMFGQSLPYMLVLFGTLIITQVVIDSMPHLSHLVQLILRAIEGIILVGVVVVRFRKLQQVVPPEIRAEFYQSMVFRRIKPATMLLVLGVVIVVSAIAGYSLGR